MTINKIEISRAPVYTLWLYLVAVRLKYKKNEALTIAKYVVGTTAQKHGQAYGVYTKSTETKKTKSKKTAATIVFSEKFLGYDVPMTRTKAGIVAVSQGKPIDPQKVEAYFDSKFGSALAETMDAMTRLAKSMPPKELTKRAISLYGRFRPTGAEGAAGFGKPLPFDIDLIRKMAEESG